MRLNVILLHLLGALLFACEPAEEKVYAHQAAFVDPVLAQQADSVLASLSTTQKIQQLLVWQPLPTDLQDITHLVKHKKLPLSGIILDQIALDDFIDVVDHLHRTNTIPPFIGASNRYLLNNQFTDTEAMPQPLTLAAYSDVSLKKDLQAVKVEQLKALGINWQTSTSQGTSTLDFDSHEILYTPHLNELPLDSSHQLRHYPNSGFTLTTSDLLADSLQNKSWGYIAETIQAHLDYDGLFLAKANDTTELRAALQAGVQLIVSSRAPAELLPLIKHMVETEQFSQDDLDQRVQKIIMAKLWMRQQEQSTAQAQGQLISTAGNTTSVDANEPIKEALKTHFNHPYWEKLKRKLFKGSAVLVNNHDSILPFNWVYKRGFYISHVGPVRLKKFDQAFGKYANYKGRHFQMQNQDVLPELSALPQHGWTHIITLSGVDVDEQRDQAFLASLHQLAENSEVIVINFGHTFNLEHLDPKFTLVQFFEINATTATLAPQLLFGGFAPMGTLPVAINDYFPEGTGLTFEPTRFEYAEPEEVGIASEKLSGIDAIAHTAIKKQATPGCQIVVAKSGKIIYSKSFGHHTYDRKQAVRKTDVYDIASITKVAATTLAIMDLAEKKQLNLNDKLRKHLDLPKGSSIRNLTLKKLLTHKSGLKPHLPVVPFLLYRDQPNAACDSFFCKTATEDYTIQIADSFYFKNTYLEQVWADLNAERLGSQRRHRYSDANFYLLQKVVEQVSGLSLDQYVNRKFYYPLGLRRLGYRPLEWFREQQIPPTQLDERWRHQLVQGYVHDESAALMGGVAGHAGLFSNAEDLAVIFQMLLDKGQYGTRTFFAPTTIEQFTSKPKGSQRAIGFDKPYKRSYTAIAPSASAESFGHTGFTGTCAWVDPEQELVYIFLSNRLHPNIKNRKLFRERVRERIQEVVYDALDTFTEEPPKIDVELSRS